MNRIVSIVALAIWLPWISVAQVPLPTVDLRVPGNPPLLSTWAHAHGKAIVRIEAPGPMDMACDVYQVDGKSALVIARGVAIPSVVPGANQLEIPLPEPSARGRLLIKITSSGDGNTLANLIVDILPEDAWASLTKHASAGGVYIDPSLKTFRTWAATHGVSKSAASPEKPVAFYFGKAAAAPGARPPGRYLIFERESPDALPVIEVLSFPEVTKILVPPGFLENLPDSATSQALLLRHLKLLP
ncbi:MAG: hypothetical protein KDN05_04815 [Verrucomicrobiae bacterium]|nr:hypothetical protein [Verrucomicrobiae bacterium]